MPGTTRYSATFDRTYEEEDRVDPTPPPITRRSRSQSWQAHSGLDGGRPYTPLGGRPPNQRSSSTDNGSSKGPEHIPTRTVGRTAVKAHSNPFQFVKVGTCPLYRKAEEQLKKAKEVKKPDVLKEEEEEWQSNLDSWKSRRRKMSEDVFRRAEEIRQFELEEQVQQVSQKKTKTFSEMVEQRATRGRALSLCLISSPMELQNWEFEGSHKNGSCSTFSGESEENSTVNSEDEGVSLKGMLEKSENGAHNNHRTNGDSHIEKNDSNTHNGDYDKLSDLENNLQIKPKEGSYIDSGLESISSHRAGDTPDSGSDFSHDSGSSIDCDSPRTGVNLLEEFTSKSSQISPGHAVTNGTTNGFSISEKKSESTEKANKSEVPKSKPESVQYEKSIESENEMYVDDYEELQRQSELLAASGNLETHIQANGSISAVNGTAPNITISKVSSTPKLMPNVPNGSVDGHIKTEPSLELGSGNQKNADNKVPIKTRRKGVYAFNVSATPNEISKEANSVSSLFPLSPVTELPSPEDTKTMASTLSNLTSASDSKKEKSSKEVLKEAVVELSPNTKENLKSATSVIESSISKKVTPEEPTVIVPKIETRTDAATIVKSIAPASPQNDKPKLVLKKVKTKTKKVIPPENQIGKEFSASQSAPISAAEPVKKDEKSKVSNVPKAVLQNEDIKNESKQTESPKNMENVPAKAVANTDGSKSVPLVILKNIAKDEKKTDSISLSSTEITENKVTNASSESPQGDKPKPSLSPKKVKKVIKIKKVNTSENTSAAPSKQIKEISSGSLTNTSSDLSKISVNKSTTDTKSAEKNEEKKVTGTKEYKKTEPSTECKVLSTEISAIVAEKTTPGNKITAGGNTQPMETSIKKDGKAKSTLKNINDEIAKTASPSLINSKDTKIPMPVSQEKSKPSIDIKKTISKPKNANSQKVNTPAKQIEECKNLSIDSLNVVFQSEPKHVKSENQSNVKNSEINSNVTTNVGLVPDVPPVEKVAEEMEKLILEQLEEEERAKELASGLQIKSPLGSPEHLLIAPPKLAEPPKEKPPPPPLAGEGSQKETPLKRVNSTKRIKKEICKRRSNFLGIDNADESLTCNEPLIPPPPALEEILKAEMELDRQSRLKIKSESTERLTQEEKEIRQKEREIIESLESEERQKQLLNCPESYSDIASVDANDVISEEERILLLKTERKRLEAERLMAEEQQLHLIEEKQLREREEFIRKQEADKPAVPPSDNSLSVAAANAPNTSKPSLSSLSTDPLSCGSLSGALGDGNSLTSVSATDLPKVSSENNIKEKTSQKPAVPPKPLKKKEAIRKERERLRQEQEALQREREEHRRKLQEQEELLKQKSHAPEAPVASWLGPLPPLVPSPLTNTAPQTRDSASFPSRSHHGAPNGASGSNNTVELMGPAVVRQKVPPPRKVVQNDAWGQQKVPSVRKQNQDSLTESRYNQNHWLIQEAEMRRIAELKERQRPTQLSCSQTCLAEDDVCSNSPRVPVISPPQNQHLNYHTVQDKIWNYASQPSVKKYPSPVGKEPLHTIYPRETVSQQPPMKPSRVVPMERQEQMLSVSGRKRCSHCNEELGRGAAMIIESLQLYYHINCFQCCVCHAQLGNGSCGTDVRVRNQKLHCHNCYSNDEAGLKFSQV